MIIKEFAQKYAPNYNLSYSRIYGNAITGIQIDDLAYQNKPLAKHIILHWNPNGLVQKNIIFSNLTLKKTNVKHIKSFIKSFEKKDDANKTQEKKDKSSPFAFKIKAHSIIIELEPYEEEELAIAFSKTSLKVDNLVFDTKGIEIEDLVLNIESNLSEVYLQASLLNHKLNIKSLRIKDLDTLALESLLGNIKQKSNTKTGEKKDNIFMPKNIYIDKLFLSLLSREYDPLEIKSIHLYASKISFDTQKSLLEEAQLNLDAQSNLTALSYHANIENNILSGQLQLSPQKDFFDSYIPTLNPKALKTINIELNASQKSIIAMIDTEVLELLKSKNIKAKEKAFNLDILKLKSKIIYDLEHLKLTAVTSLFINMPYAQNIHINNDFKMDKNTTFSYKGKIFIPQIIGVEARFVKPLEALEIEYEGDNSIIWGTLSASNIEGNFNLPQYKKADIHLETKKDLLLRDFITLPKDLNQSKAKLLIDMPLSFEENSSLSALLKIKSNLLNIDADIEYKETLDIQASSTIPQKSLLKAMDKKVKWKRLNPLNIDFKLDNELISLELKNKALDLAVNYNSNNSKINGKVALAGVQAKITGKTEEKLNIQTQISSFAKLIKEINTFYTLKKPPLVKGKASINIEIDKLEEAKILLSSDEITFKEEVKSKEKKIIKNISLDIRYKDEKVILQNYALEYDKQKVFAKKPSHIIMENNKVSLSSFWLNDSLEIKGDYDKKQEKGIIDIEADKFELSHQLLKLNAKIKLKATQEDNKTNIQGKITINGGKINYNLSQKRFVNDSDIQIKERKKKEKASSFMDNLSSLIQIETTKPLVYKEGAISIRLKPNISIQKFEKSPLKVYGAVEILKGGRYLFEGKRFVLKKSYIYFSGDASKPLLEVAIKYQALNHLITIRVTGSPEAPNINFSSSPYLSEEEILSLILFDSVAGANNNSGTEMMRMMGGAMAKSALSNIGVKLDHLVLGEGNAIEIGKKISNRIMIIYVNDIISSVRVQYKHNTRTQSVINMNEESQSYDIIYKDDFSLDLF